MLPVSQDCPLLIIPSVFSGGFFYHSSTHLAKCVVAFWILCCDVHYDFCIKLMFGSSLPPVVSRRAHVLFMLFVFVCIQ
jgi:hypothetical protein